MDLSTLAQLGDCEAIHEGWLKQPANAWSSLAFGVVGIAVAASAVSASGRERVDRAVFGSLLVATGFGSFLFHGPQPAAAHFLHDVAFLAALWYLGVANLTGTFGVGTRRTVVAQAAGVGVIAGVLVVFPAASNVLAAILAVGLVAADIALRRVARPASRWYGTALGSLIIGIAFFLAGRTGSPLCDSEGVYQAHAGWHILAAVFLGSYLLATAPARRRAAA